MRRVWAVRFTANVVSHAASKSGESMGEIMLTPALFTRMSTGPNRSTTSPTTVSMRPGSRTSRAHAAAWPPASRISSATAAAPSSVTSVAATSAPSSAKRWAVARPIPLAAPVTTVTRPATDRLNEVSRGTAGDLTQSRHSESSSGSGGTSR